MVACCLLAFGLGNVGNGNGCCRVAPQAELVKAQGPYCSISAFDRGAPSPTYWERGRCPLTGSEADSHLLGARPIPTYWERGRCPLTGSEADAHLRWLLHSR